MIQEQVQELLLDRVAARAEPGRAVSGNRTGAASPGYQPTFPLGFPPVHLPRRLPDAEPERDFARPVYSERFRCVASACEDTCCSGWGVPIDQATYEKYRANDVMKPFVGTLVVINTGSASRSDYARMPLTNAGACGFLDANKLCGVQKALGEEMLSETCAVYPRAISRSGATVEKALNLSCPEAARVALLEPALLGAGNWLVSGPGHYAEVRAWTERPLRPSETRLAVRQFVLLLLTDRSYALWQRIYLLGTLTRRLKALSGAAPVGDWCEANPAAVTELLADSARVALTGVVRPMLREIPGRPAEQLQLVAEILRLRLPGPPIPARFIECLQEYEQGLGLGSGPAKSEQQILDGYAEAHARFYAPLMQQHPHLLENYLANHIFKNGYPFGRPRGLEEKDVESEHALLCVHAALAQTLLIGIAAYHREAFDPAHVVKLVQSLAKTLEHNGVYLEQIAALVRARNLESARGAALLLWQAA